MRKKVLSKSHISLICRPCTKVINNAQIQQKLGRWPQLHAIIEDFVKTAGAKNGNPMTLEDAHTLGMLYTISNQYDLALPLLEYVVKHTFNEHGPAHPKTAAAYHCLGNNHSSLGQYRAAVTQLLAARDIYAMDYDKHSAALTALYNDLEIIRGSSTGSPMIRTSPMVQVVAPASTNIPTVSDPKKQKKRPDRLQKTNSGRVLVWPEDNDPIWSHSSPLSRSSSDVSAPSQVSCHVCRQFMSVSHFIL